MSSGAFGIGRQPPVKRVCRHAMLRIAVEGSVLRSRPVALWPTRSNFTSALQSVATLNTEERVLRPLLPLGLGLRFTKPTVAHTTF